MTFQAELDKINKTRKRDKLGQISTPPHVATFMAEIVSGKDEDLTDKTVLDPCVGTGNLLIPMRNRGAILIGIDIDREALEMCKERIPEAILTNCNSLLCFNPAKTLRMGKETIEELEKELSELNQKEKTDRKEKNRINKIPLEIERWKKNIEEANLKKP
jgi:predicted RNA methylase